MKYNIIYVSILTILAAGVFLIVGFVSADEMTKEDAIKQAVQYTPSGGCGAAMTQATHKETGATYTFSSTCVPDGWVPTS